MKLIWFLCFLESIVFAACKSDEKNGPLPLSIIVLCDVSNSITNIKDTAIANRLQSIRKMKTECEKIIKSAPAGSDIQFYLIASNVASPPIYKVESKKVNKNAQYGERQRIATACARIAMLLDSAGKSAENNTCILTSVIQAYDNFRSRRQIAVYEKEYRLVILSDMFEECPNSPIEGKPIRMNKKDGGEFMHLAEQKRIQDYNSPVNFDKNKINVNIVLLSNYMKPDVKQKIDSFWRMVFSKKLGYRVAADQEHVLLEPDYPYEIRKVFK